MLHKNTPRSVVVSTGASLPKRIMANAEFESLVETNSEWIIERTGIEQRHIAGDGESTSTLAIEAGKQAIANAGINASDIDLLIVATTTPDDTMPSTATKVQHGLGMTRGAAFDVNAACSGFVYAMSVANSFIASGHANTVLVIGAETFSRILDWKDRSTCILFGDGAAALLLQAKNDTDKGVLAVSIGSDGQYAPLLGTHGGVSTSQTAGTVFMAGKEIYRHAISKMPEAVETCMQSLNLPLTALDWVVPHQANLRILQGVAHKLGLPDKNLISTVQKHANTSAASIPLALHEASRDGRIRPGHLVACPALGAGLTWGCFVVRW